MLGSLTLLAANIAFRLARLHGAKADGRWTSKLSADDVHVSGEALELGKWWVLVTASFDHAGWDHLANNMLMLMCTGPELEQQIGCWSLWVLYVLFGVVGWLCSLAHLRLRHGREAWECAKFQTTVGSSPATYGVAMMLAVLAPAGCCCTALGVPPWIWLALLYGLPAIFTREYGVHVWEAGSGAGFAGWAPRPRFCAYSAGLAASAAYVWRPLVAGMAAAVSKPASAGVPAPSFLTLYLLKTVLLKVLDRVALRRALDLTRTDNAAHFGGAAAGAGLAVALAHARSQLPGEAVTSSPFEEVPGAMTNVVSCGAYLTLRVLSGT